MRLLAQQLLIVFAKLPEIQFQEITNETLPDLSVLFQYLVVDDMFLLQVAQELPQALFHALPATSFPFSYPIHNRFN